MKLPLLIAVFLFVYSASSEVSEKSREKEKSRNASNTADNYGKLLHSYSIIYDLVNIATGIDFETARCKEELVKIKEGLGKKDVWTFKRE